MLRQPIFANTASANPISETRMRGDTAGGSASRATIARPAAAATRHSAQAVRVVEYQQEQYQL